MMTKHIVQALSSQSGHAGGMAEDIKDSFDSKVLSNWRDQGRSIVATHRAELDRLLLQADALIEQGRFGEAASATQVAANYAVLWHTGQFTCPRLEQTISRLAKAALPARGSRKLNLDAPSGLRVLHVATELLGIGGHARMVKHWIENDKGNVHSLALTGQHRPLTKDIADAVAASGGDLEEINLLPGGILRWARRLQEVLISSDFVVLHIHNMDVIPLLALAGLENRPRSTLNNHCDHLFWLGSSLVDSVICSRNSGRKLTIDRRGVVAERTLMLPLSVSPRERAHARPQAKRLLGISEDSVVALTIARAVKFRDIGGENFVETLIPALRANPRLQLIVVGPGAGAPWHDSVAKVLPGQVLVLPETRETAIYMDAADIYLDSFPFVSITSLMEAGLHGLPLVSRHAFGTDCGVMGADSLGLDEVILRTSSAEALCATLIELAKDSSSREEIGARTREMIFAANVGENWRQELQHVYRQALHLPQNPGDFSPTEGPSDLDYFIPFVFDDLRAHPNPASRTARATELALKSAPLTWRLQKIAELNREGTLGQSPVRAMIPTWLSAQARRWIGRATG
jgi:hypothetical protein